MIYNIGKFVFAVYFGIFNRIKVKGHENIPENGGLIICSNHIHWLDPPLIAVVVKRKINFMAKAELFRNRFIGALLKGVRAFPVKRGAADISAIKNSLRVIKDGGILGIFPEGTRSRDGRIKPAEPGVALIAVKAKAPVIPVRITGSYKLFSTIDVIIGKPLIIGESQKGKIPPEEINELSQSIMSEISRLS